MKKLYGVTAAMVTPFGEDGRVDRAALALLTEALIQKGVNCLYPCGTTGEMVHLSEKERKEIAETVIGTASGRARVFVHCGAMRQEETLELLRHAHRTGADGAGAVTPMFLGVTGEEMEAYYKTLSAAVPEDFPIYLYNIPQCAANDISPKTAARLAGGCPNITGIKYSFPDFLRTLEYLEIPDFSVLHGCDKMFAELLLMGCDGTVSGVAGVFPEPFVKVYEAWERRDLTDMQKWQKICVRFCDLLRCGTNMSWFKQALKLRGIPAGTMREPQRDLFVEETAETMSGLKRLCEEVGIELRM